jgi:hypothetical protein
MIMKPNNQGLVEKCTVCTYDDKPPSYIKLITYGKASASSMVKANLPSPSAFNGCQISQFSVHQNDMPTMHVGTARNLAGIPNKPSGQLCQIKDGVHSLY